MSEFIRQFQVNNGTIGADVTPESPEEMYASPLELESLYGCRPTEADVRFVMTLINAECNRASLWPCEYQTPAIRMPSDRQETRLDVTPVIQITEMQGRYGYGRRDRIGWNTYQTSLQTYLLLSGGRSIWTNIDVKTVDLDPATGILFIPTSLYFQLWNVIKCRYIAGYISIPARVKSAMAEIINTVHAMGVSHRISYSAGRVARRYSTDSFVTPQAKQLLSPFVVRSLY